MTETPIQPPDGEAAECSVTAPPEVEHGVVVLHVLHVASGRVFRCEMSDFDAVSVTLEPAGLTPSAEGDARAVVAEAAREHAEAQRSQFTSLFEQARTKREESGS